MKRLLKFVVFTSFFSANFISIDLGFFQLSPFRMAVFLSLFLFCLIKLTPNRDYMNIIPKGKNKFSVIVMLFWFVYAIITVAWVKDFDGWIRELYFLTLGVISIGFFSLYFKRKEDLLTCFRIMEFMIIVHNVIGWYEIVTRDYRFTSYHSLVYYSNINSRIPISMMGNPNDYALLMLFGIFISYIFFKCGRTWITRLIAAIVMLSSTVLIFFTESRANVLGLIMAIILFMYISMSNRKGRRLVLLLCSILFLSILFFPDLFSNILSKFSGLLQFNFELYGESDNVRINLIKNGLLFLISTFGFGTGAGNIEYWMANRGIYYIAAVTNMHNWWAEILTGYGIVVFLLYVSFYIKLFIDIYRLHKNSNDETIKSISLGVLCCMFGFLIGSISSSSNIRVEWLWVFWAVVVALQGYITTVAKEMQIRVNNK